MELWQTIGTALGLGLLSGIRLYLTVFAVGLSSHFGWVHFTGQLQRLEILGDYRVLIVAGIACLVEFLADKIPWVDSMWDAFHTFIRPIAAALLASTVAADLDPALRLAAALLVGGVALTSHSAKASARLVVNHSPEPFSNIAASLLGDIATPLGVYIALEHPLVALGCVALFLLLFAWLAPRIWRLLRLELTAFTELLGRLFIKDPRGLEAPPEDLRTAAEDRLGVPVDDGLWCAATRSVDGLKHSVGWLCPTGPALVFVTRRGLRKRVHVIDRANIKLIGFNRGLLLHRLTFDLGNREQQFYCFPGTPPRIVDALQGKQASVR